jgi:ubiquinone/menaquinone biosynthesis C-methylase UbiE
LISGKTASDYGRHRAGFTDRFFDRLFSAGFVSPSDRVLDLGTGTGTLARGFALRGCEVVGLDVSRALLNEAKRQDAMLTPNDKLIIAHFDWLSLPGTVVEATEKLIEEHPSWKAGGGAGLHPAWLADAWSLDT